MKIEERIVKILKEEILEDETIEIGRDEDLLTSGLLDSMALIRLVAAIEQSFDLKIPPTDLVIENFISVRAIDTYLSSQS